jgi:hypothetical protein
MSIKKASENIETAKRRLGEACRSTSIGKDPRTFTGGVADPYVEPSLKVQIEQLERKNIILTTLCSSLAGILGGVVGCILLWGGV